MREPNEDTLKWLAEERAKLMLTPEEIEEHKKRTIELWEEAGEALEREAKRRGLVLPKPKVNI